MAKYLTLINPLQANRHRAGVGLGAPVRKITAPASRAQPDSPALVRHQSAKAIRTGDFDILVLPSPATYSLLQTFPAIMTKDHQSAG